MDISRTNTKTNTDFLLKTSMLYTHIFAYYFNMNI